MTETVAQLERERDPQLQQQRWQTKTQIEGAFQRLIETLDAEIGNAEDFDTDTIRAWLEPCAAEAISAAVEQWQREQARKGKVIL